MTASKVRTCNVVVSGKFNISLDLDSLAMFLDGNIKYNPLKFPGLIVRENNPKRTYILYKNGSVVCLGTKSPVSGLSALSSLRSKICCLGFACKFQQTKICNAVGCFTVSEQFKNILCRLPHDKNLGLSVKSVCDFTYEPEVYCGIVFRPSKSVAVIAFHTGKAFVTGCSTSLKRNSAVKTFLGIHKIIVHELYILWQAFTMY